MNDDLPHLFHITEPELWAAAQQAGVYVQSTRGATLDDLGFIHCSFAEQVETVARLVYGDYDGDLVVLRIDPTRLDAPVRVEDLDGTGQAFPHVYGPIPTTAVVGTQPTTTADYDYDDDAPGRMRPHS